MAILMPYNTRNVLGARAEKCESRSLYFDRFADPQAKEDERNAWFERVVALKAVKAKIEAWRNWLGNKGLGLEPGGILLAKLQSRLMVNMAGGVMKNAGLCLDRFGVPYIPGSSVKGCARRMAIQTLLEAREADQSAGRLARLLADIALIFGWGEQDWSEKKQDDRFLSDFAYAVGAGSWSEVSSQAQTLLPKTNQFAGAVSFLPAYPFQLPPKDLELDVITCHHQKYYEGKMPVALDTEEPIPVKFPAAAANLVFQFVIVPIRIHRHSLSQTDTTLHLLALEWLGQGLETFGVGAKTAAGYGWFDCSEAAQTAAREAIARREKEEAQRRQAEAAAAAQKAKEEAERNRREMMANLTPDQQEDLKAAQLKEDQFRSALENFAKKTPEEQKALVRALRLDAGTPGSRRAFWDELKARAQKKGGKPAQIEQSIRQLSKQMFPGKEGKMP